MTHMVEHSPWHAEAGWPWLIIIHPNGTQSIRCTNEKLATRVAQALDLLERSEQIGDQIISDPDFTGEGWKLMERMRLKPGVSTKIDDKGGFLHRHLDGRYHWLSEKEIMQRAREAAVAVNPNIGRESYRGVIHDDSLTVLAAARALRDLAKPLADLVPPPVPPVVSQAPSVPGIYRVFWKSGGSSLAAVGLSLDGKPWIAATNWISPSSSFMRWEKDIERFETVAADVPPVDPDLIEARKISVEAQSNAIISPGLDRKILEGRNDNCPLVQAALAAIKRGRELAGG